MGGVRYKALVARLWRDWIRPLAIVLVICGSFRSAVADWNDVPTGSMKPTIVEGDRIFVNKIAYGLRLPFTSWWLVEFDGPERGDIVVLFSPEGGTRLVKRIVGTPGDQVELRDNRLIINGQPASYGPLDRRFIEALNAAEHPQHQFARERIAECSHPVMSTPTHPAPRDFGPISVPDNQYFVMGDNRDNSRDSRTFGCVQRDTIVGEATSVVFSIDPDNYYLPRWNRFLRSLQ